MHLGGGRPLRVLCGLTQLAHHYASSSTLVGFDPQRPLLALTRVV
jgi:hypothetical protein